MPDEIGLNDLNPARPVPMSQSVVEQGLSFIDRLNTTFGYITNIMAQMKNAKDNPMLQKIVGDKMKQAEQVGLPAFNSEVVFVKITSALDVLQKMWGDIPISQLQQNLVNNKQLVQALLEAEVQQAPAQIDTDVKGQVQQAEELQKAIKGKKK